MASPETDDKRTFYATLTAIGVLFLLTGSIVLFTWHDRRTVEDAAYTQAENFAIAFEEYVHNIISSADDALLRIRRGYNPAPSWVDELAQQHWPHAIIQASFVGPDGMLRHSTLDRTSTPTYLGDREHFKVHLDQSRDVLFVSRPVLGRVSGKWSIQLSRKVLTQDGHFAGVLVVSIERREITDFFQRIQMGKDSSIALIGQDRWIRARATSTQVLRRDPYAAPISGKRPFFEENAPPTGRYQVFLEFDDDDKIGAYRQVRNVPLLVTVLFSRQDVLQPAHARLIRLLQIGGIAALIVMTIPIIVSILERQRRRANQTELTVDSRWKLALDVVGDGVWDWTIPTGQVFYSRNWSAMLGLDSADITPDISEWRNRIHPEDDDRAMLALNDHFNGSTPSYACEVRLRCRDQSYRWILSRGVVIVRDAAGQPERMIGLHTDITPRKQLEDEICRQHDAMQAMQTELAAHEIRLARRKLSMAQNIAILGIIEFDQQNNRWIPCDQASTLLGLPTTQPCDLDDLLVNIPPSGLDQAHQAFNGSIHDLDIELTVLCGDETSYIRAIGCDTAQPPFITLQNVTARRAAEQEQSRIKQRMEEANRWESLGTLAGGIAHEINTPAQFVCDNLSFLKDGVTSLLRLSTLVRHDPQALQSPDIAAFLKTIRLDFLTAEMPAAAEQALIGVDRIAQIVRAVKDYCYPSARDPQPFDLNHVIHAASTVTRNTWKYNADLDLELAPDLPQLVANEGEISQVVVNLLVNAAQAIEERGDREWGHIVITTRLSDQAIQFSIQDNGIGIPQDRQKKIFELFYTTKPPGTGTGQGLAISSAIVRRHGGTIDVKSAPNQGSTFTVTLPQSPVSAE